LKIGLVKDISTVKYAMLQKIEAEGTGAQADARRKVAEAVEAENQVIVAIRADVMRRLKTEDIAQTEHEQMHASAIEKIALEAFRRRLRDMATWQPTDVWAAILKDNVRSMKAMRVAGPAKPTPDEAPFHAEEQRLERITEARVKLELALENLAAKGGTLSIDSPELLNILRVLGVTVTKDPRS
jgi:hypothetical protein